MHIFMTTLENVQSCKPGAHPECVAVCVGGGGLTLRLYTVYFDVKNCCKIML
jgi:hypothetical protein